jgi:hypothetical protein
MVKCYSIRQMGAILRCDGRGFLSPKRAFQRRGNSPSEENRRRTVAKQLTDIFYTV